MRLRFTVIKLFNFLRLRLWIRLFTLNPDPDPHQSDANLRKSSTDLQCFIDPPCLHCERSELFGHNFEPLKLLNFHFNSDSVPDPDPASQNNADPCGSAALVLNQDLTYALWVKLNIILESRQQNPKIPMECHQFLRTQVNFNETAMPIINY
jgi:hypothetical protein